MLIAKIQIYCNEIHSSIHISMVLSEISLKVKSNGYTFMEKCFDRSVQFTTTSQQVEYRRIIHGCAIQLLHTQWEKFQTALIEQTG